LRRQPQAYLPIIDEAVEEMLKYDIIEKSNSPWASNLLMVKKKDTGKWRTCVDFRHVNAITKKDSYPLPRIDACFDALGGRNIFPLWIYVKDFSRWLWTKKVATKPVLSQEKVPSDSRFLLLD
jgi:hypothetical protein